MSAEVVAQAKADIERALGKTLTGNDESFLITMEAAFRLGLGVVFKPSGNHATFEGQPYSVDGNMTRDGRFFDVLFDSGGENRPVFNENGTVDTGLYRPAKSVLGSVAPAPAPTPSPQPDTPPLWWSSYRDDIYPWTGRIEECQQRLEHAIGVIQQSVSSPPAAPKIELTPEIMAAVVPMLTKIFIDAADEWVKRKDAVRFTVTPKKK